MSASSSSTTDDLKDLVTWVYERVPGHQLALLDSLVSTTTPSYTSTFDPDTHGSSDTDFGVVSEDDYFSSSSYPPSSSSDYKWSPSPENTSPFSVSSDFSSTTSSSLLNMNRDLFLSPLGEYVPRDHGHHYSSNRRFTNNNKRLKRSRSPDHQVSHEEDQTEAKKGNNKERKNSKKNAEVKSTSTTGTSTTLTGRSSSEPKVLEVRVSSILRCAEACLQETSFQCLSANFERVCQLSCFSR